MAPDIKYELYEFFPIEFVNRIRHAQVEGTLIVCKVDQMDAILSEFDCAMIDFQGGDKIIFVEVVERL